MCVPKAAPDFDSWLADQTDDSERALLREVYDVVCEGKELGVGGRRLRQLDNNGRPVGAALLKLVDAFHVIKVGAPYRLTQKVSD